ncbi:MAG: hypothetical protein OER90_17170, partial [Gemmatimonadota bacterium]|nr:hypothetical protein [Gemmatimonadota bacterium]
FWLAVPWGGAPILYALYTWSGVLATIVVVRFWTVLGNLFTVTQAKRIFAVIGSGSVLGAILGSGLARILSEALPARHLVAAAATVFLLASLGPRLLARIEGPVSPVGVRPTVDLAQVGRQIWDRPYLRSVATLILFSTVTFTLVDFVFKLTVSRLVAVELLDEFFSSVYLTLNIISLVIQVFVVGWLFRRAGVSAAVASVPFLLVLGSVGFAVGGGLTLVLLLKGIDGSLRHSLYRTGTELLFVPIAVEVRGRVKAVIDVLGQRGGQALASLGILLVVTLTTNAKVFGVIAILTGSAWLVLAWRLRGRYLDVFRETLSEEITETRLAFPALDLASLETLLSTLNDIDDRKVIAALDILVDQGKVRVIPALILYHPSPTVVVHALGVFSDSGRDDVLPIVERLRVHGSPGVRAAALLVESVLRPERALLEGATHDPAPEVQATAVVGLVASGWLAGTEADQALETVVTNDGPEAQIALAKAIAQQPDLAFESTLMRLAVQRNDDVELAAVAAMREVGSPRFVPVLLELLSHRSLRDEVQLTLIALGSPVLPRLVEALRDAELPHAVRRHLPRAIGAFGTQQAADLLLTHLVEETDGMVRFKILRALGRLGAEYPHLSINNAFLARAAPQTLTAATGFMRWRRALEAGAKRDPRRRTPLHALLVDLLRDKQQHSVERVFRLLNLQTRNDDFLRIYRGLHSSRRESRAGSRELLENLVPVAVRRQLLDLIDDALDPASVAVEDRGVANAETVLKEMVESQTESLSAVAAHYAAELGLVALAPVVEARPALSPGHGAALDHARERLGQARIPRGPRG